MIINHFSEIETDTDDIAICGRKRSDPRDANYHRWRSDPNSVTCPACMEKIRERKEAAPTTRPPSFMEKLRKATEQPTTDDPTPDFALNANNEADE